MFIGRRIARGAAAFGVVTAFGVAGYVAIEGWSLLDALYMTLITVTTVGYDEVRPLSTAGKAFSMVLMVGGVGVIFYMLTTTVQAMIEGEFMANFVRRRRMKSRLAGISSHFIVCGYGRVGREVARALAAEDLQVVVVDSAVEAVGDAQDGGMLFVQGDATHDETLSAAGIEGARGLIVATDDDSDNVLITLSARGLKSELTIVARGADAEAEAKLVRAGADRVVSVHRIAGRRMAWSAARPLAVEFFDTMTDRAASGVRFVEVEVVDDSPLANTSPQDLESSNGVQVLAISRKSGELLVSPPESTVIQSGDRVMLAGNDGQIQVLEGGA